MKKVLSITLFALTLVIASGSVIADSVVVAYNCELKEGKKAVDVQAINSKWLAAVRTNVNKDITSSMGTAIVGDFETFLFVDSYPDLNTWAATQTWLDSDAANDLDNMFDETAKCTKNRLWKFKDTK